jgi:hypothetical protein
LDSEHDKFVSLILGNGRLTLRVHRNIEEADSFQHDVISQKKFQNELRVTAL